MKKIFVAEHKGLVGTAVRAALGANTRLFQ